MRTKLRIFLFLYLIIVAGSHSIQVQAQAPNKRLRADIRAGINFAQTDIQNANKNKEIKIGLHVGGNVNYKIYRDFQVQTGFYVTKKGLKQFVKDTGNQPILPSGQQGWSEMDYNTAATYLQMPFNIGYEAYITDKIALNINGGLYAAYGIKGKKTSSGYRMVQVGDNDPSIAEIYKETVVDTFSRLNWKSFDYGLNGTVGIIYDIYAFNLNLEHGLYNVSDNPNAVLKNRVISLSLGFRF